MLNYFYARKDFTKKRLFSADVSLDFGYLGKTYNAAPEFHDYGFKDF